MEIRLYVSRSKVVNMQQDTKSFSQEFQIGISDVHLWSLSEIFTFHPFTLSSRDDPFLHRALKFHASNLRLCFHLQPGELFGVGQECDCTEILLLTLQGSKIAHLGNFENDLHKYLWEGICQLLNPYFGACLASLFPSQ